MVAAVVIGEVVVRVFDLAPVFDIVFQGNIQHSENSVLQYGLRPGSPDGDATISSAGLRDREFAIPKPRDVYRIVVIGDSVTYGFQLEQHQTFPKRLELLLNRHASSDAPTYQVLNLGVNGYNVTQVVEALRVHGLPFEPDLVIYAYVLNDPQGYSLETEALAVLRARAEKPLTWARYFPRSRLMQMLSAQVRRWNPNHKRFYVEEPGYVAFNAGTYRTYFHGLHNEDVSWKRVEDGLANLARLASQAGDIPVLVAVMPIETGHGFASYALQDLHDMVVGEAQRNGLFALDLAPVFRAAWDSMDGNLYRDFLHPNERGNDVLAVALLKWLDESEHLPGDGSDFRRLRDGEGFAAQVAAVLAAQENE